MASANLFGVALAAMLLLTPGCARKPPREVAEAQEALEAGRDACASQYVAAQFEDARLLVEELNELAVDRKYRRIRRVGDEAIETARQAERIGRERMATARTEAEAAIAEAAKALQKAEASEAHSQAGTDFAVAKARLEEARRIASSGDCDYAKVKELAAQAKGLAAAAESQAVAVFHARHDVNYGAPLWSPLTDKANRSQITDPALIYPAQAWKIPRDIEESVVETANDKARDRTWQVPDSRHDGK